MRKGFAQFPLRAASLSLSYLRLWREGVLSDSFQLSASIAKLSNYFDSLRSVAPTQSR